MENKKDTEMTEEELEDSFQCILLEDIEIVIGGRQLLNDNRIYEDAVDVPG